MAGSRANWEGMLESVTSKVKDVLTTSPEEQARKDRIEEYRSRNPVKGKETKEAPKESKGVVGLIKDHKAKQEKAMRDAGVY